MSDPNFSIGWLRIVHQRTKYLDLLLKTELMRYRNPMENNLFEWFSGIKSSYSLLKEHRKWGFRNTIQLSKMSFGFGMKILCAFVLLAIGIYKFTVMVYSCNWYTSQIEYRTLSKNQKIHHWIKKLSGGWFAAIRLIHSWHSFRHKFLRPIIKYRKQKYFPQHLSPWYLSLLPKYNSLILFAPSNALTSWVLGIP